MDDAILKLLHDIELAIITIEKYIGSQSFLKTMKPTRCCRTLWSVILIL